MRAFVSLVCAAMLVVAPMTGAVAQGTTLEDVRDQGILYFKKGHFKQAKVRLDQAFAAPGGDRDFLTAFYRAKAAYKLLVLELAFSMAATAESLAGDDERKKVSVSQLVTEMSSLYGPVTFKAAKGETNAQGRIFFEAKTGIINRAKKQRFSAIRDRFRSTDVKLPATVYLPYGTYTANKVPFAIEQGAEKPPELEIFLQVVVGPDDDDSAMWWYVGIGGAVVAGLGVGALLLLQEPEKETRRVQDYDFHSLTVSPR